MNPIAGLFLMLICSTFVLIFILSRIASLLERANSQRDLSCELLRLVESHLLEEVAETRRKRIVERARAHDELSKREAAMRTPPAAHPGPNS